SPDFFAPPVLPAAKQAGESCHRGKPRPAAVEWKALLPWSQFRSVLPVPAGNVMAAAPRALRRQCLREARREEEKYSSKATRPDAFYIEFSSIWQSGKCGGMRKPRN